MAAVPVGVRGGDIVFETETGRVSVPAQAAQDLGYEISGLPSLEPALDAGLVGGDLVTRTPGGDLLSAPLPPPGPSVPEPGAQENAIRDIALSGTEFAPSAPGAAAPVAPAAPAAAAPKKMAPLIQHTARSGLRSVDRTVAEAEGLAQAGTVEQLRGIQQREQAVNRLDQALNLQESSLGQQQAAEEAQARLTQNAIEHAQKSIAELDDHIDAQAKLEPDPKRFWNSKTGFQQAMAGLAVVLTGLGRQNSDAPNPALASINEAIDKDVQIQMDTIDRGLKALQQKRASVGENLNLELERVKAIHAARTARVSTINRILDVAKQRASNDEQRAAITQAQGQLLGAHAEKATNAAFEAGRLAVQLRQLEVEKLRIAASVKGEKATPELVVFGPGGIPLVDKNGRNLQAPDKERAREVADHVSAWAAFKDNIGEYRDLLKKFQAKGAFEKGWSKFSGDPDFRRMDGLRQTTLVNLARLAGEKGPLSNQDLERFKNGVPQGTLIKQNPLPILNKLENEFDYKLQTAIGARGVDVITTGALDQAILQARALKQEGAADLGFDEGQSAAGGGTPSAASSTGTSVLTQASKGLPAITDPGEEYGYSLPPETAAPAVPDAGEEYLRKKFFGGK